MSRDRFWDDCADAAIRYINAQADSREIRDDLMLDLRRSYADQLSDRRWENRNFNELVDGIVAAYDRVDRKHGDRGDSEADIIDKTVEIVVDGHFAELVLGDSRVSRELSNAIYNEMKDARSEAQDMVEGSRRERRHEDDDRGGRGSRRDRDDRRDSRDSRRDDRRSSSRGSSRGNDDSGSHWLTDIGSDDKDDRREDEREERSDDRREERPAREERPEYHHVEQAPRREDPDFVIQGPDYTKAKPYDDYWLGEEHYQAAAVTNWKLTGNGEDILSTIPSVYDVNTHIKYYVMNERGEVREELIEVTDDTRYLAHQLREETREPDAKPRTLSAGISLANREDGVSTTRIEQRSKTVRLAEILREIPEEQMTLGKADTIDSIQGAVFESQVKMVSDEGNPRIDLHILRTPVLLRSEEQLQLIDQVHAATTLTEASDLMMKLKPEFEKPLWETLNRRFSVNTIRASTYQFQFDIAKLNFSTSYGKLLAAFRDRRGAEEAAAFAKRMHFVSDIACCHIVKEDLQALAGDLIGEATNVNAAVFIDFAAIISVDHTLDDIGLGLQLLESKEGLVIEPHANSALFLEIRKLYSRLDEVLPAPQKGRLLLSTSDNRLVEVLPFAARKEAFILAMAQL